VTLTSVFPPHPLHPLQDFTANEVSQDLFIVESVVQWCTVLCSTVTPNSLSPLSLLPPPTAGLHDQ